MTWWKSYKKKGSLEGKVFEDKNHNGVDDHEPGKKGIKVELLKNGHVVATVHTDEHGNYKFKDLDKGSYVIRVEQPPHYDFTKQDAGKDIRIDSDVNPHTGETGVIHLGAGQHLSQIDAGLKKEKTGSVEGRVFKDKNHNGVDDHEPGKEGVKVELLRDGHVVATTHTDAHGNYEFKDVKKGDYKVRVEEPDHYDFTKQDAGKDWRKDSDVNPHTGETKEFHLRAGEHKSHLDAGLKEEKTGSVEGRVFKDTNHNGIDDHEPGKEGVKVELLRDGHVVDTTHTDAHGNYTFKDVKKGDYTVRVEEPDHYDFTKRDVGKDWRKDSDVDPHTGETKEFHLRAGEHKSHLDAGVKPEPMGSIEGRVFKDKNHDNVDNHEPGKEGVTVKLLLPNGHVVATTHTDAHGAYSFDKVKKGDYIVHVEAPDHYEFVHPNVGHNDHIDSDVDPHTGKSHVIHVDKGEHIRDVDAGVKEQTGSIEGRVFKDVIRNDIDDGEPGVAGVEISLVQNGVIIATTHTDDHGSYSFKDLKEGGYVVHVTEPEHYKFVDPNIGHDDRIDSDVDPFIWKTNLIILNKGQHISDVDAGLKEQKGSIIGRVFEDCDHNGFDTGLAEDAKEGVTVELLEVNPHNPHDIIRVVETTVSDRLGTYYFDDIEPGSYVIRVHKPEHYEFTIKDAGGNSYSSEGIDSDVDPHTGKTDAIHISGKDEIENIDVGLKPPTGSIEGRVFKDQNHDNVDNHDPGKEGVTVNLLRDGHVVATTHTDAHGGYKFDNVKVGGYVVHVVAPDHYEFVHPNAGSDDHIDSDVDPHSGKTHVIHVNKDDHIRDVDAGVKEQTGSIEGRVFKDVKRNDIEDPGEPGVAGVEVSLVENGKIIATTHTDDHGSYSFKDLKEGGYVVHVTEPKHYKFVDPNIGHDDRIDSDVDPFIWKTNLIILNKGQHISDVDAGLKEQKGSIIGRVFKDLDHNGLDTGAPEEGKEGVKVDLLEVDPHNPHNIIRVVETTVSDRLGTYYFDDLEPGSYVIRAHKPDHYEFTKKDVGDNDGHFDGIDSDVDPHTGKTDAIHISGKDAIVDIDIGVVVPKGSIEGRVFKDKNHNGIDNHEPGKEGVTVKLLQNGHVIETTHTDAHGGYQFDKLDKGDYVVKVVEPDHYTFTKKDVGHNDHIDSDVDRHTGKTDVIHVDKGEHVSDVDAGLKPEPTGSVEGHVFKDRNKDGIDHKDPGVKGVTVKLLQDGHVVATTHTNNHGNYEFKDVKKGDYVVKVVEPDHYDFTKRDAGKDWRKDSDVDQHTGETKEFHLRAGEHKSHLDAGLIPEKTGSVEGHVFKDRNKDGIDHKDPGVKGVTVKLLQDGHVVATTHTNNHGNYEFKNVKKGDYVVKVVEPDHYDFTKQDVGKDWRKDSDVDQHTGETKKFHLDAGEHKSHLDAGLIPEKTGSIEGRVFNDKGHKGIDDHDAGVKGVKVKLFQDGHFVESTHTDRHGEYEFDKLKKGDYVVKVVAPDHFSFTHQDVGHNDHIDSDVDRHTGATDPIHLDAGEHVRDIDAGVIRDAHYWKVKKDDDDDDWDDKYDDGPFDF